MLVGRFSEEVWVTKTSSEWCEAVARGTRGDPRAARRGVKAPPIAGANAGRHLAEAKVLAEQHRVYHNLDRPHSSLDYQTPAEFAASLAEEVPLPRAAGEAPDSPKHGEVLLTLS